jgi:IS4 transposase
MSTPTSRPDLAGGQSGFLRQYNNLFEPSAIIKAAISLGVIKRQRKIDLPELVRATVLALSPIPGTQTSALTNYSLLTGHLVAHSSFYDRFTLEFASLMKQLADRAIVAVREAAPDDPFLQRYGVLFEQFADVRIADSTSKMLKKLAKGWARSTSKTRPAGVKLHAVVSLRDVMPVHDQVTRQRTHDNKAFPDETLLPDTLSLFDLGYLDVERFVDADGIDAYFLTRKKSTHDPVITRVHVGKGSRIACRDSTISQTLADGILLPEGGAIDVDVRLVVKGKEAVLRAVAIVDTDTSELHWYLTNVGRDVLDPHDVAETYRLRWYIELLWKQLKSGLGLEAILAWREEAVLALIYSKIVALCLARLLELELEARGVEVTAQLATVLALARSVPLLLSYSLMGKHLTMAQLEQRLMMIAEMQAKSRNRRREAAKRSREQGIGRSG